MLVSWRRGLFDTPLGRAYSSTEISNSPLLVVSTTNTTNPTTALRGNGSARVPYIAAASVAALLRPRPPIRRRRRAFAADGHRCAVPSGRDRLIAGGNEHPRNVDVCPAHSLADIETVESRHVHVEQDAAGLLFIEGRQEHLARCELGHAVAGQAQQTAQRRAYRRLFVDDCDIYGLHATTVAVTGAAGYWPLVKPRLPTEPCPSHDVHQFS